MPINDTLKDYSIVTGKNLDTELNTSHISNALGMYEAARTGFFTFEPASDADPVLQLIANKMRDYDRTCKMTAEDVREAMKLNVTKAKVPHFSLNPLEYRRGNEVVKFAGVPTFDSGSFTIDDIVGLDTKSMLEAWLELAYNLYTRTGGRMYEYKMNCLLTEYTQDYRPIRTWDLVGCFISDISEEDFDKENDGKRSLSATVQYDRATMYRGVNGVSEDTKKRGNVENPAIKL